MVFSSQNLKLRLNSRECSSPIQAATYPPFTKGTHPQFTNNVDVWMTSRTEMGPCRKRRVLHIAQLCRRLHTEKSGVIRRLHTSLSWLRLKKHGVIRRLHSFFGTFCLLWTLLRVDICNLLHMCKRQCQHTWHSGACYAEDETIAPHKGKKPGRLRQFVPRKPHQTWLKLYVLADSCRSYVINIFL